MKPPKLKQGDTVALVAPSNSVANKKDVVERARQNFEKATDLKTVLAPHALGQHFYSSGTVDERLSDLHWAIRNTEFKAIIFLVGGNTAVELVEGLDYELLKQNPKVIAGISDATTLLDAINVKTGLITFLGLEFMDYADQNMDYETASIKKAWFEGSLGVIKPNPSWKDFDDLPTAYSGWQTIKPGVAEGTIVGGNFGCFAQLRSTPYWQDMNGSILVFETYKKQKKQIHQILAQLKLWGVLAQISGLIIGYNVGSDDPSIKHNKRSLVELVLEVTDGFDFPIMWMGEVGHNVENIMLPMGAKARLDAGRKTFEIIGSVTA